MELALDEQRVDDAPGVVAGHVADEAHPAGLGVDLDDGDVGAERERRHRPVERRRGGELGALFERRRGDICPRQRHGRCAGDVEVPLCGVEDDVGDVRFQLIGGDAAGDVDELGRRGVDRGAADLQRA